MFWAREQGLGDVEAGEPFVPLCALGHGLPRVTSFVRDRDA